MDVRFLKKIRKRFNITHKDLGVQVIDRKKQRANLFVNGSEALWYILLETRGFYASIKYDRRVRQRALRLEYIRACENLKKPV